MAAGDSASARAQVRLQRAAAHRRRADADERVAVCFEMGAEGERRVRAALGVLESLGYQILDDRRLPHSSGNIDHLVVGPFGVAIVDAKNWSGSVTAIHGTLRQDRSRRTDHVDTVTRHAAAVAAVIAEAQPTKPIPVLPIICFAGDARLHCTAAIDEVVLTNLDDVAAVILDRDPVLDPIDVAACAELLDRQLPPRTAAPEAHDTTAGLGIPTEPVVFLKPWNNFGERRLYVSDEDGIEGGFLDLRACTVTAVDPEAATVLEQLLPHYADQSPNSRVHDDGGALRRLVSVVRPRTRDRDAIIACKVWQRAGTVRLYVHRVAGDGSAADLGSVNVESGELDAATPDSAATLSYCSERYCDRSERRRLSDDDSS